MTKVRKTPTGESFQIVDGELFIDGDEAGRVGDELFISNLEDKYTKSIRVVSVDYEPHISFWVEGQGFEQYPLNMQFTIRCEKRGNFKRWDAYRRVSGVLRKVFIGKTEEITIEKLVEVARKL